MNVYHRLSALIACLYDEDFQATIPNIAKAIGIYEQQVKQDLDYLLRYEAPKGHPLFAPYIHVSSFNGEPCYHMNAKALTTYGNPAKLHDLDYSGSASKLLPMTIPEYNVYSYNLYIGYEPSCFFHYDFYGFPFPLMLISNRDNPYYDADIMLTVDKAIRLGEAIRITLEEDKKNEKSSLFMTPHFIKQDIDTELLYVIETYEDDDYILSLPVTEIASCEIVHIAKDAKTGKETIREIGIDSNNIYSETAKQKPVNPNKTTVSPETVKRVNQIWSYHPDALDEVMDEEPVHVKLQIYEDTSNIIEQIRKDTYRRAYAGLYGPVENTSQGHDSPNVYYYEDDILGINSFKRWVRKFGSSIVVLEPKELAYDIYKELAAAGAE